MRCPHCGKILDIREAMIDDDWRAIFKLLDELDGHGRLFLEYIENFSVHPLRLKTKKIRRLLEELHELYHSGIFKFKNKTYRISKNGVVEALKAVCNKHFEPPLTNHNYLKQVMIGISEREEKERIAEQERKLRQKEDAIRNYGIRDEETISAQEFKKRKGIESLASLIGKKL